MAQTTTGTQKLDSTGETDGETERGDELKRPFAIDPAQVAKGGE